MTAGATMYHLRDAAFWKISSWAVAKAVLFQSWAAFDIAAPHLALLRGAKQVGHQSMPTLHLQLEGRAKERKVVAGAHSKVGSVRQQDRPS
jgi:hypothetical protein